MEHRDRGALGQLLARNGLRRLVTPDAPTHHEQDEQGSHASRQALHGFARSITSFAIARERSVACDSRPAATPSRSGNFRFWLTFHLPCSLEIGISMPTMR